MRTIGVFGAAMLAAAGISATEPTAKATSVEWAINATAIEACSCPMFCQCYFSTKPAAHGGGGHDAHGGGGHEGHGGGEHFCRFNMAYKINHGRYGDVKLDGAKFWIAGDLGGDFSKGQTDWSVVTFDKAMTREQREGLGTILGHVFPVKWKSLTTAEGTIDEWKADKDSASASLNGGKGGVIRLKRWPGNTSDPIVISNLKYWGTLRNDGFVLMPNEIEAYRLGDKPFEFKGSNGFMITIDMNSKDVEQMASVKPN